MVSDQGLNCLLKAIPVRIFNVNSVQRNIGPLGCLHVPNVTAITTADVEDIYSFAVNTINIFIEGNANISIFTRAKHE